MTQSLEEHGLQCPYCGQPITLLVDASCTEQEYVEDCEVCCRPMLISARLQDGVMMVDARHENE
jgi:hypothetical protein